MSLEPYLHRQLRQHTRSYYPAVFVRFEYVRAAFLAEVPCITLGKCVGSQMLEIGCWRSDREVVGPESTGQVTAAVALAGDFLDRGACDGECDGVGVGAAIA